MKGVSDSETKTKKIHPEFKAKRLIRTLKEEEIHLNAYENITEARTRIEHFIEHVYHQKRPHAALTKIDSDIPLR